MLLPLPQLMYYVKKTDPIPFIIFGNLSYKIQQS